MAQASAIHFCPRCGGAVAQETRFGKLRPVCPACGWVYFANPRVAAAALVEQDGRVLLIRRAFEPFRGLWTLPAGYVDAGEDPTRAAERECLEETGLGVRVTAVHDVIPGLEHPRGADMVIIYRAEIVSGGLHPADDADAVDFFPLDALPPLAFQATRRILELFRKEVSHEL
jgi:ADP-ribose pyrophosphatase YjhB (NUDIX family)